MDFALLKEHPKTAGAVVLGGGLLLFLYWRSGAQSAGSSVTTAYAPAQASPAVQIAAIQAGQQLQAQQLDAANRVNQENYQIDALRIASAADLSKTIGNNNAAITAA